MENCNIAQVLSNRTTNSHHRRHHNSTRRKGPSSKEKSVAEKILLRRIYTGLRTVQECPITNSRAKFLIVFSPDGTKLASTNGNHNVYIIDVRTKKILKTLTGHKRTPWTVAFHPTNCNILASGCLSGEVRVWNLEDDSCEIWQSPGQTVIASLAFHPKVKLLLIATYKDIYFWDWNASIMLGQTSTDNEEEKIRYVKFDSTGDKLITAIALSSKLLSQFDSISLREVFHFTRERTMLEDFRLIEKHCEKQMSVVKNYTSEEKEGSRQRNDAGSREFTKRSWNNRSAVDIVGEILPFLCTLHRDAIQSSLNVECFCPTKFSEQIVEMLQKHWISPDCISEKCYICRYMWLYRAIFELKLINGSKYHICKDFRFMMNDKHIWKFDDHRLQELKRENDDPANGLTEQTIRYCYELFARTRISPYFQNSLPNGVCSSDFDAVLPENTHSKVKGSKDVKKPFAHNVTLRSDCFLNVCEMFQFNPSGIFSSFLTVFAELYQYLPALQQISTKEDGIILNSLITEWEYLYCKLLLISKIIDGDNGLMMSKQPSKAWNQKNELETLVERLGSASESNSSNDSNDAWNQKNKVETLIERLRSASQSNSSNNSNDARNQKNEAKTQIERLESASQSNSSNNSNDLSKTQASSENSEKKKFLLNELKDENSASSSSTNGSHNMKSSVPTESVCDKTPKLRNACSYCKTFDENPQESNLAAMKLLRKDLDDTCTAILRRNEPKTQRSRIERLYRKQFDNEINRKDGALFRTIQITKKCIRMYLSSLLTELKKLLKVHWSVLLTKKSAFSDVIFRLFIFVTRRTITYIGSMLEFLCNFKYDINELTKIDSIKIATSTPLLSMLPLPLRPYRLLDNIPHRRDYTFEINSNDEPVFDEEIQSTSSDLSDDELSSSVPDQIFSSSEEWPYEQSLPAARSGSSSGPLSLNNVMPSVSSQRITVSSGYLQKHLRFFDFIAQRWPRGSFSPDSYQLVLLQNVNSLFNHFLSHSNENAEYRNNSHPLHRLQMWDFSRLEIPAISSKTKNVVVTECKVHNDATITISSDDKRVAVLLSANQYDQPDWLGVFSLEWKSLGQILCAVSLNQIAVSLSFSPTDRYLAVGYSFSYTENIKMADIVSVHQETEKWNDLKKFWRRGPVATSLIDISRGDRIGTLTTVNCITWIPVPGQGLVFGNSVGELKFVS